MRGRHRVVVQTANIKYDFTVRRNITVITGNSATGKTTLIEMISDFRHLGRGSGVSLECDKNCEVLEGFRWELLLSDIHDSIVFIDEESSFVKTQRFARQIKNSDNYYVIVSREKLSQLPYSVEEIYGMRESSRYGGLRQKYNELYQLYKNPGSGKEAVKPTVVVTEDTNAGYEFFYDICQKKGIKCITSGGKSNVLETMLEQASGGYVIAIVDGAAFGPEMERMMEEVRFRDNFSLYAPESFEWLILQSDVLNRTPAYILEHPEDYIESEKYFSWEQFFTQLLMELTENQVSKYTKARINPYYLSDNREQIILSTIKGVEFDEKSARGSNSAVRII